MEKIIIFGFGEMGRRALRYYGNRKGTQVVAVVDNFAPQNVALPLIRPAALRNYAYDRILVTVVTSQAVREISLQLQELGIAVDKICYLSETESIYQLLAGQLMYDEETDPRVGWLRNFAAYVREREMAGSVAECGVYWGDFSFFINKYFPDRTLYLFDTFEGFSDLDLAKERSLGNKNFLEGIFNEEKSFSDTSVELVEEKLLHFEKCVVKKGFFPETTAGVEDTFCFVSLDMDLYQPMLAGLEWFYPRLEKGGVLLLHDYFHPELPGVKQAVKDYEAKYQTALPTFTIGDFCSLGVLKV